MDRCETCGRGTDIASLVAHQGCYIVNSADCWRTRAERLQAERDEALENIERMKLRYYEIDTERMRLESECERLTRERVDIGVKYDLLRARIDAKGTET